MFTQVTGSERMVLAIVFSLVALGVGWSLYDVDHFKAHYVIEDGFIEWLTVFGLFLCALTAFKRMLAAQTVGDAKKVGFALLCGCVFIFGLGEEVSWGQRIFNIDTPGFFQSYNAQNEMNLHNLKFAGVKINKLVFGLILSILVVAFLLLTPILYRKVSWFAELANQWGLPIPAWHHVAAYAVLFALISMIPTSKKGELLEFGGVYLFFVIFNFPINKVHLSIPQRV